MVSVTFYSQIFTPLSYRQGFMSSRNGGMASRGFDDSLLPWCWEKYQHARRQDADELGRNLMTQHLGPVHTIEQCPTGNQCYQIPFSYTPLDGGWQARAEWRHQRGNHGHTIKMSLFARPHNRRVPGWFRPFPGHEYTCFEPIKTYPPSVIYYLIAVLRYVKDSGCTTHRN